MSPRPPYMVLRQHFPDAASVPAEELWRWIGHPDNAHNPQWHNTCAIRMSLSLLGAGVNLSGGFLEVAAGKYKGKHLEIEQEVLASQLERIWGPPEKFGGALLRQAVGNRRGVIRFLQLWGPFDPQGHIDLIAPDQHHRVMAEGGHVYGHAVECWFWECP